ncbi:isopentenyl-diphosphate delta-isomerase [Vibrio sp. UCD-FRSSP16_10]|uniref:ABC-ATPase domain-containing protein n=1 Tax=unclassified Vibrio TaxID=2614977 RepID=UPI0007FE7207|nr:MULTISPECIES: ABC-ATPase domain-containing protein [unclassified Vibrio]OBT07998.1 isopentenyl-diphosphate delta-isomerase [Vibrio sp. UCD-FRSSP16_30]OBT17173.1 isopentenyl-diphosphate delta-isomerase [Vibrio sp. UCD-FRSSP16_10]
MDLLISKLKKLEKQNYRAYQQIKGSYDFTDFTLHIDQVQGDPYATASRFRAVRPWSVTGLDFIKDKSPAYQIAARDFIARTLAEYAKQDNAISVGTTGQVVLDNTAVLFTDEGIELRFRINLPADGRSILAKKALNIITFYLPKYLRKATLWRELSQERFTQHCEVIEDQHALRQQLAEHNLVSFIADDATLPRLAGDSDMPMKDAVPMQSPDGLSVTLQTPNRGEISGLGIKKGITLIVGGGFHGKSTLLNAIEKSIYDHIPGDGREYCVTDPLSMKIRAEDGRCVHNLNIANFINHLPMQKSTTDFSTQDASGSTSQAAWLQESIESGAKSLLIDEDTSATNFMIRDERMQALVAKDAEPITPLVDRIAELRDTQGISSIIVMGGSGDYLDEADCVIQMHEYQPVDVTSKAKEVIKLHPSARSHECEQPLQRSQPRAFNRACLQTLLAEGKFRVGAKGVTSLRFGKEFVDITALEQLQTSNEVNAIGWLWFQIAQVPGWSSDVGAECQALIIEKNWHTLMPNNGDLAKPRILDLLAILNRLRKAQFKAA